MTDAVEEFFSETGLPVFMLIGNPEGMRAYKEGRYLCLRRTNFHPARFLLRIVIFVLHQSVEDEGVERDNHDRQHRRHRDMNEPPDDPQASECEPRLRRVLVLRTQRSRIPSRY